MKGKKREKLWQKQKLDLPNDLFFQSAYSLASLLYTCCAFSCFAFVPAAQLLQALLPAVL